MAELKDYFWNWGHLEGSHNEATGFHCSMTLTQFAREYGIPNAFVISYGGNIQPPYDALAEKLSGLREIKWSVLGDTSTPLPESRLGCTQEVIDVSLRQDNITGGIVDDFFSEERLERFPPAVLKDMKAALNKSPRNLDFWAVLYEMQLDANISQHLECFDGVSFWIWYQEDIDKMEAYVADFLRKTEGKRKMLGIYLWDYATLKKMELSRFQKQLDYYVELLKQGVVEGIIFCSGCIGDSQLETNAYLKKYIKEKGNEIVG